MEILIRLFAALRLDILANDFFIPMTPDGTVVSLDRVYNMATK